MTKRTAEQWQTLFQAQQRSGLSAAAFCKANSLCPKYFSLRRRQLNVATVKSKPVSGFVKVQSPSLIPSNTDAIVLQGQFGRVSLPVHISSQWLAALLRDLG